MPAAFNLFFRIGGNNSLHGLFKFRACQHYKMPAAAAFYTEIHAGAQNFPFVRAAGVPQGCGFFIFTMSPTLKLFDSILLPAFYVADIGYIVTCFTQLLDNLEPLAAKLGADGKLGFNAGFRFGNNADNVDVIIAEHADNVDVIIAEHGADIGNNANFVGYVNGNAGAGACKAHNINKSAERCWCVQGP